MDMLHHVKNTTTIVIDALSWPGVVPLFTSMIHSHALLVHDCSPMCATRDRGLCLHSNNTATYALYTEITEIVLSTCRLSGSG